jgi:hypothetical protein
MRLFLFLIGVLGILNIFLYSIEDSGLYLLFSTVVAGGALMVWDYLRKKDVFSPLFFFTSFYLLWMCGGFFLNYIIGSFFDMKHQKIIPLYIFIGYVSFVFGYCFPVIKKKKIIDLSPKKSAYSDIIKNLSVAYSIAFLSAVLYYSLRWKVLFGGPIQQTRFQAVAGFGYIYHLMAIFSFFILVFLASKWFFEKPITLYDWLLIFIAFIPLTLHLHRGPIIWLVIWIIFARHYLVKRVNLKKMLICAIVLIFLAAFIQSLRWSGRSLHWRVLNEVRVHVYNLSFHLTKSEEIGVPLGIKPIWMSIALLKPGPDVDFAIWLKEQYDVVSIPSVTLIGEGFMSYKILGIILEFSLIGFLVKQFYYLFRNMPSLRNLYLYMILICQSCSAITYGLHKVLISTVFGMILAFLIIPKNTLIVSIKDRNDGDIDDI